MKILVVGGGIAGLTIGWRLAQSGYHVGVIERGRAGRSATWAAAGMLGSAGEHVANPAMSALAAEARAMWPAFASDLAAASGHEFGFCRNGALRAAFDAGECAAFATRARELVAVGDAAEWVDAATARKIAPLIASDVLGALFFRDEAQVDNRRLSVALVAALTRAGGVLHEGVNVHSLSVVENRITGVVTTTGNLRADAVVIAAGAWSALLGANLPEIRPAKGQMLALAPDGNDHLPIPTLWGPGIYLVPRNGRLFVGATVEDVG